MLDFNLALEGECSRAGHVDVVVGFAPLDVEGAAVHDDVALPWAATRESCGNGRGTGSCAAGHRDATATFPYAGPDVARFRELGKLDVATLRKGGVMFQFLSPQGYICLADVIREYDKVGVAHADEGAFEAAAIDGQFAVGHLAVAHSQLLRIL